MSSGQSKRCNFAPWSTAPKTFLDDILKAASGALPVFAKSQSDIIGNTCNTLKQRGAMLHGDTVPCYMKQSYIVWTDLKRLLNRVNWITNEHDSRYTHAHCIIKAN